MWENNVGYFFTISDQELACLTTKRGDVPASCSGSNPGGACSGNRSNYRALFDDWAQWLYTHPGQAGEDPGSPLSIRHYGSEWDFMVGLGCSSATWFSPRNSSDSVIDGLASARPDVVNYFVKSGFLSDSQGTVRPLTTGVRRMCLNQWWYRIRPPEYNEYNGDPQSWANDVLGISHPGSPAGAPPGNATGGPSSGSGAKPSVFSQALSFVEKNPLPLAGGVIALLLLFRRR